MAITLRDVASRAGVSPVVVSKVLHNKAPSVRVSDATAERVRQAARDLGYRVNVFARNFRAQQTFMIGVLNGAGFQRPVFDRGSRYFAALIDGIISGAFAKEYSVTLCPTLLGQSPEEAMSDGRFDGLVWYSTDRLAENREMLLRSSVPLVLIHGQASDYGNRFPTVVCDNGQGVGLAVDHLIGLGHRRIAFACETNIPNPETTARLNGFHVHMLRHGLAVTSADLIAGDGSLREVDRFYSRRTHTAIIAFNDQLASDYIKAAHRHGVAVPEELSIVGFDSTGFCDEQRPTLTSIRQPLSEMGTRAIELLVEVIAGRLPDPLQCIFPCGFDVRGSTSRPPAERP